MPRAFERCSAVTSAGGGWEAESSSTASYGNTWACGSAEQEARNLLPLLRTAGYTVADVIDLIRVAPEEEKLLRAFAEKFPDLKFKVELALDYRLRVEEEFECLVSRNSR